MFVASLENDTYLSKGSFYTENNLEQERAPVNDYLLDVSRSPQPNFEKDVTT